MRSLGILIVRLVVGGLLAGHGAQKLFGWFGGAGLEGTAGWMESLRLRPGTVWARVAGGSELGGGLLTALGLLNPLGPIAAMGAMSMAWAKVHLGNPVWSTKGGAELPLTNLAVLSALTIAGPGRLSLDSLFGIRVSRIVGLGALAGTLGAVFVAARREIEAGTAKVDDVGVGTEREATSEAGEPAGARGEDAADTSAVATGAFTPGPFEDRPWTERSGADAGTSMGEGSPLGSETPEAV
jgi:putative oxidoreductase